MQSLRTLLLPAGLAACLLFPAMASAQFTLTETGGTFRTDAVNLAATATAIGQDELGLGVHYITNINNGTYGNASSWIGNDVLYTVSWEHPVLHIVITQTFVNTTPESTSWVGVQFATPTTVASLALGRDNTGALSDRVPPSYLVQYATEAGVWNTLGMLSTSLSAQPALRNLYNLDTPLGNVVGLRIVTSTGSSSYGSAIDELEVYSTAAVSAVPEPSTYAAIFGLGALGLVIWRRRQSAA